LAGIRQALVTHKEPGVPQWYINGQGQTLVVLPGPMEFVMGSPATEVGRMEHERQHKMRIDRTFAVAAKSVTVEQFRRFDKYYRLPPGSTSLADLPAVGTSWYQAASYCNWLSKEEGIPNDQWCYEIKNGQVTKLKEKYLSLTGYRLPTEAEIEYATRAGALTSRYYGETEDLLPKYAWYQKNSKDQTWPVGSLKPNDWGLFDVHGNVLTWCQERHLAYPHDTGTTVYDDEEDITRINPQEPRALRSGSFFLHANFLRSATRFNDLPTARVSFVGFRVARTFR